MKVAMKNEGMKNENKFNRVKIFKYIYLIILYVPSILNLLVFYAYVCRATIYLGHFPSYGRDPSPGDDFHERLIYALFYLPTITLIAIFVGLVLSFVLKGDFFKKLGEHYFIAFFLIIIFYIFNPFWEWFLD